MTFHVYENWIAEGHKCRIHRSDCSFCNEGRGVRPTVGSRNGIWHGPFPDLQEALSYGLQRSPNTRECGVCKPSVRGAVLAGAHGPRGSPFTGAPAALDTAGPGIR